MHTKVIVCQHYSPHFNKFLDMSNEQAFNAARDCPDTNIYSLAEFERLVNIGQLENPAIQLRFVETENGLPKRNNREFYTLPLDDAAYIGILELSTEQESLITLNSLADSIAEVSKGSPQVTTLPLKTPDLVLHILDKSNALHDIGDYPKDDICQIGEDVATKLVEAKEVLSPSMYISGNKDITFFLSKDGYAIKSKDVGLRIGKAGLVTIKTNSQHTTQ